MAELVGRMERGDSLYVTGIGEGKARLVLRRGGSPVTACFRSVKLGTVVLLVLPERLPPDDMSGTPQVVVQVLEPTDIVMESYP